MSWFPLIALDPDNKPRSLLVDEDGKLVTDRAPLPAVVYPATLRSMHVDEAGELQIT